MTNESSMLDRDREHPVSRPELVDALLEKHPEQGNKLHRLAAILDNPEAEAIEADEDMFRLAGQVLGEPERFGAEFKAMLSDESRLSETFPDGNVFSIAEAWASLGTSTDNRQIDRVQGFEES